MGRVLTILEVSQKQAFIFSSNKMRENIRNSAIIAWVLSPEYIQKVLEKEGYSDGMNMVYSGGGHTVLQFDSLAEAKKNVSVLTEDIYRNFDGLEVFAKSLEYDENYGPAKNLENLTTALERKKSVRSAAFKHGTYGVESIDSSTLNAKECPTAHGNSLAEEIEVATEKADQQMQPEGYNVVKKFEYLGGSKNETNFIAVVHIDGNGMGKRVKRLYEKYGESDWNTIKVKLREFSEGIDKDFKDSFKEMNDEVGAALQSGRLDDLKLEGKDFPVRRVISAGDDICFVTEGRIGIECARIFIEKLTQKKNCVDGEAYGACAGVAIVHQKYPFFRAYELSEMLCSNAKKYGAVLDKVNNGADISSIDWHIEYGEIGDSIAEIRQRYIDYDGNSMVTRPYIIKAPKEVLESDTSKKHQYSEFKRIFGILSKNGEIYSSGKIKELRGALKQGKTETKYYLDFNIMRDLYEFEYTEALFDVIEVIDSYLIINGGNK